MHFHGLGKTRLVASLLSGFRLSPLMSTFGLLLFLFVFVLSYDARDHLSLLMIWVSLVLFSHFIILLLISIDGESDCQNC